MPSATRRPGFVLGAAARLPRFVFASVFAAAGLAACNANDPVYYTCDDNPRCTPTMSGLEVDGMGTEAKQTIQLKFRTPTAAEEKQRQNDSATLMYEVPWLREDRVHIELRYSVTNYGDSEGTFSLNLDGASEFYRYDEEAVAAAFTAANEKPPEIGGLMTVIKQTLSPGEVYQGTVREDDFSEASLDLEAMGRFMGNFLALLINRSDMSPLGLEMVPPKLIRPALWEITPRFNADQHMGCQFLVRVRDDDRRLWEDGDPELMPNPETYMPVVMMMP